MLLISWVVTPVLGGVLGVKENYYNYFLPSDEPAWSRGLLSDL